MGFREAPFFSVAQSILGIADLKYELFVESRAERGSQQTIHARIKQRGILQHCQTAILRCRDSSVLKRLLADL